MQNRFVEIPALHQSGLYPRQGRSLEDHFKPSGSVTKSVPSEFPSNLTEFG